jgi:tetratricopeptide (TPR) repeat protein
LLIEFTTRDDAAVPPLDSAVYDDQRFLSEVGKQFVPVRLAVSTESSGGRRSDIDVIALAQRLEVGSIPSLVLADPSGRPYAAVESSATSVDEQLGLLRTAAERRVARDELLARSRSEQGADRAKSIAAALDQVGRFATAEEYTDLAQEVAALDRDGALGLAAKYASHLTAAHIDREIQARVYPAIDRADYDGAIKTIDELIATSRPTVEQTQMLTAFKAELLLSLGRRGDAERMFDAAIALAPNAPTAEKVRGSRSRLLE